MNNLEELFEWWLDSLDTTQNVIDHLKSQKLFHIQFAAFVLREYQEPDEVEDKDLLLIPGPRYRSEHPDAKELVKKMIEDFKQGNPVLQLSKSKDRSIRVTKIGRVPALVTVHTLVCRSCESHLEYNDSHVKSNIRNEVFIECPVCHSYNDHNP